MATTTRTGKKEIAVKKPLDLSTAKQIDGAVSSPKTVDDLLGLSRPIYDTRDLDVYRRRLSAMHLYQLQSHAQKLGVVPSHNRQVCIQRLETAFAKDMAKHGRAEAKKQPETDEEKRLAAIRDRAERIMRGERLDD